MIKRGPKLHRPTEKVKRSSFFEFVCGTNSHKATRTRENKVVTSRIRQTQSFSFVALQDPVQSWWASWWWCLIGNISKWGKWSWLTLVQRKQKEIRSKGAKDELTFNKTEVYSWISVCRYVLLLTDCETFTAVIARRNTWYQACLSSLSSSYLSIIIFLILPTLLLYLTMQSKVYITIPLYSWHGCHF